jgi:hypothetical protein
VRRLSEAIDELAQVIKDPPSRSFSTVAKVAPLAAPKVNLPSCSQ